MEPCTAATRLPLPAMSVSASAVAGAVLELLHVLRVLLQHTRLHIGVNLQGGLRAGQPVVGS